MIESAGGSIDHLSPSRGRGMGWMVTRWVDRVIQYDMYFILLPLAVKMEVLKSLDHRWDWAGKVIDSRLAGMGARCV